LALKVIKDRHDFDAISVHVPGTKCFGRNVHLVEIQTGTSVTALISRRTPRIIQRRM